MPDRTIVRTCPLCESTCGLELTVEADRVVGVRGDALDVFSRGYLCPKGTTLPALHEDPDRLRTPLVRRDGALVPVSWAEAFAEAGRVLAPLRAEETAVYQGNPVAHTMSLTLYPSVVVKALGTRSVYTPSTADSRPRDLASALVFGERFTCPVPDVDRTDFLLMLGANPAASNGSLATAPDWPGRLKALTARGGTFVVVDPRRTRTAQWATEHLAVRPAGDPWLLLGMLHVIVGEGLLDLGGATGMVTGLDDVRALVAVHPPETVADRAGISADTIRRVARAFATAPRAAAYGRMGTTTGPHGTLTTWLIDLLNILTGNLDRPGGSMFTRPAARWASNARGRPRYGKPVELHRFRTRVRGAGETLGELPVSCLAEEIDVPGEGRIRGLVTIAGNPVLSAPDSARLDAALAGLDAFVAVDQYVNETTRHAHVILPPPSALERPHYDFAMMHYAVRNVANYSPAPFPVPEDQLHEWEVLCRLAAVLESGDPEADPRVVDERVARSMVRSMTRDPGNVLFEADPDEILEALAPQYGPERLLDLMLRTGPYGEGFGRGPGTLSLEELRRHPHGMDFGALVPMLPDILRTPDGMIALAPAELIREAGELAAEPQPAGLLLIGRRALRSNNSWMHNLPMLVTGGEACTLLMHPDDADARGLDDGDAAEVRSASGTVTVPVETTTDLRPGVVCLPHGWGHDLSGVRLGVAGAHPGVNSNLLTDPHRGDPLSGTAVLNAIPVEVAPAPERTATPERRSPS